MSVWASKISAQLTDYKKFDNLPKFFLLELEEIAVSSPILSLRGVNKSFGPVNVLKGVDFDTYAGKVTALVGDNGAGKSTLIKCIAGIYTPESGDFLFDGQKGNLQILVCRYQRCI